MSLSESYTESFSLLLIIKIWLAIDLGSPKSSSLKLSPHWRLLNLEYVVREQTKHVILVMTL